MRYIAGIIIGALAIGGYLYGERTQDLERYTKRILFSAEKSFYTGCMIGSKRDKKKCKEELESYMKPLRRLLGERQ